MRNNKSASRKYSVRSMSVLAILHSLSPPFQMAKKLPSKDRSTQNLNFDNACRVLNRSRLTITEQRAHDLDACDRGKQSQTHGGRAGRWRKILDV